MAIRFTHSGKKDISSPVKDDFKTDTNIYAPAFVKKILRGKEDVKNGKGVKIAIEDLWK